VKYCCRNNRTKTKLTWASERAMIASRWTWLQAQVSDLEYRIRQQSDLYRQLRSLKGAVTLDDPPSVTAESLHSVNERHVSISDKLHTASSCSGVSEPSVDCNNVLPMTFHNGTCRAARCLPIQPCRRRRLLRPPGDTRLSTHRKATLLPALRCTSCHPPATPCALCAGKVNNSVSLRTNLTSLERIALLDAAFHPVLSFNAGKSFSFSRSVDQWSAFHNFFGDILIFVGMSKTESWFVLVFLENRTVCNF